MIFTEIRQIKEWIIANSEFFLKHEQKFSFIDVTHLPQRADDLIKNIIFCETDEENQKNIYTNKKFFYLKSEECNLIVFLNEFEYEEEFLIKKNKFEILSYNSFVTSKLSNKDLRIAYNELIRSLL